MGSYQAGLPSSPTFTDLTVADDLHVGDDLTVDGDGVILGNLTVLSIAGMDIAVITSQLSHQGTLAGFFNTPATTQPTAVPVTIADVHAALVTLGLIT